MSLENPIKKEKSPAEKLDEAINQQEKLVREISDAEYSLQPQFQTNMPAGDRFLRELQNRRSIAQQKLAEARNKLEEMKNEKLETQK